MAMCFALEKHIWPWTDKSTQSKVAHKPHENRIFRVEYPRKLLLHSCRQQETLFRDQKLYKLYNTLYLGYETLYSMVHRLNVRLELFSRKNDKKNGGKNCWTDTKEETRTKKIYIFFLIRM